MGNYSYDSAKLSAKQVEDLILAQPEKMGWFLSKGYAPHYYQVLFHTDKKILPIVFTVLHVLILM